MIPRSENTSSLYTPL